MHRPELQECMLAFVQIFDQKLTPGSHSDYSGLPVLKAVMSPKEELNGGLFRFWIYGSVTPGEEIHPFLFINGGAATLSTPTPGVALIQDAVTQRQIQALEHGGNFIRCLLAITF